MERLEVELSEFTLRSRSAVVSHVGAALVRGLEPGEQVVLHDAERGYYAGEVVDFDFTPTDTLYRIRVGVRLGVEDALERLDGAAEEPAEEPADKPHPGRVSRQELLDLLGDLRASGGRSIGATLGDVSSLA